MNIRNCAVWLALEHKVSGRRFFSSAHEQSSDGNQARQNPASGFIAACVIFNGFNSTGIPLNSTRKRFYFVSVINDPANLSPSMFPSRLHGIGRHFLPVRQSSSQAARAGQSRRINGAWLWFTVAKKPPGFFGRASIL